MAKCGGRLLSTAEIRGYTLEPSPSGPAVGLLAQATMPTIVMARIAVRTHYLTVLA
jgi:hypothetical protein